MHADKINVKKTTFLDKALSLTWASCFFKFTNKSPHHKPSKDIPKNQNLKWIQKTMKKAIVILQWVNFCFQNT
jgi:hypothetical protein